MLLCSYTVEFSSRFDFASVTLALKNKSLWTKKKNQTKTSEFTFLGRIFRGTSACCSHSFIMTEEDAYGKTVKERNQIVTSNILLQVTKFLH